MIEVKSRLSGLQGAGKPGVGSCQCNSGWCHKQGQEVNGCEIDHKLQESMDAVSLSSL